MASKTVNLITKGRELETLKEVNNTEIFAQYQFALDEYLHYVKEAIDEVLARQIQQQIMKIKEKLALKQNNIIVGIFNNPSVETDINGNFYIRIEE